MENLNDHADAACAHERDSYLEADEHDDVPPEVQHASDLLDAVGDVVLDALGYCWPGNYITIGRTLGAYMNEKLLWEELYDARFVAAPKCPHCDTRGYWSAARLDYVPLCRCAS